MVTQSTKGSTRYQPIPRFPSNYYLAQQLEKIMSALTDLQAAVASINTAVSNAVTEIQALAAKIGTNTDDPDVEAAAGQIQTLATNLQSAVDTATPPATPSTGS